MSDSRPAYPPFDERDWRTAEAWTERDIARGRALVADATADHKEGRHDHHSHPWCRGCFKRDEADERSAEGLDALTDPRIAYDLLVAAGHTPDERFATLKTVFENGILHDDTIPPQVEALGVDLELYNAWGDYLQTVDDWETQEAEARTATERRAARYLLLHGRPPKDDGPGPTPRAYADLYLDRAQLDTLPTLRQLIDRVIPRHAYGLIIGRDGTFKSFVALDWACSLATGRPWQGRAVDPVRVLYIAGEGAYGIASRVTAWEQTWGRTVDPTMLTVRSAALNLHRPGPDFDHLLEHVATGDYGLVIIDTLRRVSGAADGNGSEMGPVIDNIDQIRRATLDGSVFVIAHTGKSDIDARGFSGIEDDADVVWKAKREDGNRLDLENTKSKDGPDGHTFHLHAREAHGSLILEEAGATVPVATESQVRLLDTMRTSFPTGGYSGQIHEASGIPKSTYYRVIASLLESGHLVNTGTKHRPFYELPPNLQSHAVPPTETPSDLHRSHKVPRSPTTPGGSPTGPTTLGVGPRDHDDTNTTERDAS